MKHHHFQPEEISMDDVNRRQAMRAAATSAVATGALAYGGTTAQAQAPADRELKALSDKLIQTQPTDKDMEAAQAANRSLKHYRFNELFKFTIEGWLHCLADGKTYTNGHVFGFWFGLSAPRYYLDQSHPAKSWVCDGGQHSVSVVLVSVSGVFKVGYVVLVKNSSGGWDYENSGYIPGADCT
jgi:hypothetical protein